MNEQRILLFDSYNFSNCEELAIVGNRTEITYQGFTYYLKYPSFYKGGMPVYVLVRGYPFPLMLGSSEEFENLIESVPFHGLNRELNDYIALTLFKRRISIADILNIILLVVLAGVIAFVIGYHLGLGSFGIVFPAMLKPRKKKQPKIRKNVKREFRGEFKRLNYQGEKPGEDRTGEDALYILAWRMANAKKVPKNAMALSVLLSNPYTASLARFYEKYGVDYKLGLEKLIARVIKLHYGGESSELEKMKKRGLF